MTSRGRAAKPRVVVCGLGPAGADLVTGAALDAVARIPHRFVRTTRHPSAGVVGRAPAFDALYEAADGIEQVYAGIVEALVAAACQHGEVLYAVPGSPAVAEHTVELLLADERVDVEVVPALSFVDLAWVRLGVDPVDRGVRLVDGHRFAVEAAGERGPLLVAQCDTRDVLSEVKLAIGEVVDRHHAGGAGLAADDVADAGHTVTVLQRLGLPDEAIVEVAWNELDRVEAYEVLEAIDHVDVDAGTGFEALEEELGDLLFQVVFHATLAAEEGRFTLADVARGISDKLIGRHPHVFGDASADSADEVATRWEQLKKAEKGRAGVMDGIPEALPALLYALKVQKRKSSVTGSASRSADATTWGDPLTGDRRK